MQCILINFYNDTINIICKNDDSGEPLIFGSVSEAQDQMNELCQDGMIVLVTDTISILKECYQFIEDTKFLFGSSIDVNNLQEKLVNILT